MWSLPVFPGQDCSQGKLSGDIEAPRGPGCLGIWGGSLKHECQAAPRTLMVSIHTGTSTGRLMGQMRTWGSNISPRFHLAMKAKPVPEPHVHSSSYHSGFILSPWVVAQSSLQLDWNNPGEDAVNVILLSFFVPLSLTDSPFHSYLLSSYNVFNHFPLTLVLGLTWEERKSKRQKGLELPLYPVEKKAGHRLTLHIFAVLGWMNVEDIILAFWTIILC